MSGCPDCNAEYDRSGYAEHDDTCPLGRAVDEQAADDRDWFAANLDASQRFRNAFPSEQAELRYITGNPALILSHVLVSLTDSPGVRHKHFMGPV